MSCSQKVFPILLKPGTRAEAEAIVREFAPRGPAVEAGTQSFRVYRDPITCCSSSTSPPGRPTTPTPLAEDVVAIDHAPRNRSCSCGARIRPDLP
jgi:hypothetical protein